MKDKAEINSDKKTFVNLEWWDKVRFCFYTALGASATQMAGVMANTNTVEISDTLILTTALTFIVHYTSTAVSFLKEKFKSMGSSAIK